MTKATDSLKDSVNTGWSVHIYSGDRRLLCSLDPSHGWTFSAGIILGFLVALISVRGQIVTHYSAPSGSSPMEAPLNLD